MNTSDRLDLAAHSINQSHLELILLPTEKCNFRCNYCYENFFENRMTTEIVNGIKNLIRRRESELSNLTISWFGGEPLLAFDIIEDISNSAIKSLGKDKLECNITTNAFLLTKKKALKLLSYGTKQFHISLDGYDETHNFTRHLKNGKPTFKKIWDNIIQLNNLENEFEIRLRLHYSKRNYNSLCILLDELKDKSLTTKKISVYFSPISDFGGSDNRVIDETALSERYEIEKKLHMHAGSDIRIASKHNFGGRHICYASLGNSIGIRSNGNLFKCTVALYDDKNKIGMITEDGALKIEQSKYLNWIKSSLIGDLAQAKCPAMSIVNSFKKFTIG